MLCSRTSRCWSGSVSEPFFADCRAIEQSTQALREAIHAEELPLQRFIDAVYTEATRAHLERVVRIPEIYKLAL